MGILLGFLPFVIFALLNWAIGPAAALAAGALVSLALIVRGRQQGHELNILETGTFVLFAGLAGYLMITGGALSIFAVRLVVDTGLLVIVSASMAIGRPFTLQYARRQVPQQYWLDPRFIRTNYVIAGAWAAAFLIMVIVEAVIVFVPGVPAKFGVIAVTAALAGGIGFTSWYTRSARHNDS